MKTVSFNPLPAGARALTVDEAVVVAGGVLPILAIIGKALAAGAKATGIGFVGGVGGAIGYHGTSRLIHLIERPRDLCSAEAGD